MKKPTDREIAILLKDKRMPGRQPGWPYKERGVQIAKTKYNGADRFEMTFRDPDKRPDPRTKWWYRNWRHACAAALHATDKLEAAAGNTHHTFADAVKGYLEQKQGEARAKDPTFGLPALNRYETFSRKALAAFGPMPLHEIKTKHIRKWMADLGQVHKASTLPGYLGFVGRVLKYAQQEEWIAINPLMVERVQLRDSYTKRVEIPDPSSMETLRDQYIYGPRPFNIPELTWWWTRIGLVIMATCGLRPSEVCGLTWDKIDRDTGELDITHVISPPPDIRCRPYTKTDHSYRKVPTTPALRALLNEYAEVYKRYFGGRCVGHVIRSARERSDGRNPNPGYIRPTSLSGQFENAMRIVGLVKEDGHKPQFALYSLRHWACSIWVKYNSTSTGLTQVAKWAGHVDAAFTLKRYSHCIDDPESRTKFEQMPDWLAPVGAIEAAETALLPAPAVDGEAVELPPPASERTALPCPIDLPEIAEPWLAAYIRARYDGVMHVAACSMIHKDVKYVVAELARCKLPDARELGRRLRQKRMLELHLQGWQDADIARKIGLKSRHVPQRLRRELHKPNASKSLKNKDKSAAPPKADTRPEHKSQLKLL